MPRYSEFENHLIQIFNNSHELTWRNQTYEEIFAYKPRPQGSGGECRTDIYVSLRVEGQEKDSIKITAKKSNADFLVNKMTDEDAKSLLGKQWESILINAVQSIEQQFLCRSIIYESPKPPKDPKELYFTLGWKLEITNKSTRKLTYEIELSKKEVAEKIYRGIEQPDRRRNAIVDNSIIENSGIADYLLEGEIVDFTDVNSILSKLIDLSNYTSPRVYFAFTANNYRLIADKADGNRPLVVAIEWSLANGKLLPKYVFDSPLKYKGGTDMMPLIKDALSKLGIDSATTSLKSLKTIDIDALS